VSASWRNGGRTPTTTTRSGRLGASVWARPGVNVAGVAVRGLEIPPDELRLRFIDEAADYRIGALTVRRDPAEGGGTRVLDLPVVGLAGLAEQVGRRVLACDRAARDSRTVHLSPLTALKLDPGDRLALEPGGPAWRVASVEHDERPRAVLERVESVPPAGGGAPDWTPSPPSEPPGPPLLHLLDLPALPGAEADARPLVAAGLEPWRELDVHAGPDAAALAIRARLSQPARVGETLTELPAGPLPRPDASARATPRLCGAPQF